MGSKKKKKPVSSSTRGFATTSAPSKKQTQKADNVPIEASDTPELHNNDRSPSLDAIPAPLRGGFETQQPELSPEELEEHLEKAELQLLLDKYGENIKKVTSRHISKLQTERRLFRAQAAQIKLFHQVPSDFVDLINEGLTAQENQGNEVAFTNYTDFAGESEDDLLMKIWTLHRLLPELGFLESLRDDALRELVRRNRLGTIRREIEGKGSPWGLEFCLNLLARFTDSDQLPSYDASDSQLRKQRIEPKAHDRRFLVDTSGESMSSAPLLDLAPDSEATAMSSDTASMTPDVHSEPESDMDSDMEPDEMIKKYVEWHTRRLRINPQESDHTRKSKDFQKRSDLATDPISRKVARLDTKIAGMKSDVLFDVHEAELQWAAARIELIREAADRRKLGLAIDVEKEAPAEQSNVAEDVDGEGSMLGELFSSLPETTSVGSGNMTITNSAGLAITLRDFGKRTGISPRRVFEESCRARDSSSTVTFKSLSQTTFSKRHQLQVEWSRDQEIGTLTSFEGVVCQASNRWFYAEMESVACPDVSQSTAFISTIALFSIFGSSAKEEKAHLRLPPVWRDLWEELTLLRKQQNDDRDIQTLRELRTLIAEQTPNEDTGVNIVGAAKNAAPVAVPVVSEHLSINELSSSTNPEMLKSSWTQQSSTASYQMMLTARKNLPIWNFKDALLQSFNDNQVVIVCGETGCGKSTQVPAYIMEHELSSGRPCKIYCTEPRRISAISLARRVSEELGERRGDVGTSRSVVGFAVRLDSHVTRQTKLVYATTGIVMRMLETANGLEEVTHLVLDEVHERSIESDFLLIVLRKLMIQRPNLKVVLMSATVNAEQFSKYLGGAPVFNIPGRTFPVETRFLEDAVETTRFHETTAAKEYLSEDEDKEVEISSNSKSADKNDLKGYSVSTRETLAKFDEYRINFDLIVKLLEAIATESKYAEYSKAILIFLPGIAEIRKLNDMLVGHRIFSRDWKVFPLHSTVAMEEQERAFLLPPQGVRKLVIATNIAETGITIPDVTCVIDAGKHKEMRFDERKQLSRLIEAFISRANAKQRRGRAGRVQKGLCFHLFTKHRHDALLPEQQTPEMLRLSLQDLVLRVKICKLGSAAETLAEALDPPSARNVQRAVDSLIDVKALTGAQDLTSLGRQLARLPLDVFLGKLILLGSIFGCLDCTLAIAAILSSKSPFSAAVGSRNQADLARLNFKKGDSDLLTVYNAYCAWRRICTTNHGMSEQQFCRRNCLSAQTLANIEELKGQLLSAVVDANFVNLTRDEKEVLNRVRSYSRQRNFVPILAQYNSNADNDLMLNSVIAWSFYPKLLKRDGKGWRNVANNQSVSLHPTSVNKGVERPPPWLSFYHIMQSSNKFYNAHETSAVDDLAIALLCGEAEFKLYSGVIVIDGNRIRFAVNDWKQMIAIKALRTQIREIMTQAFKHPGQQFSETQKGWMDILQKVLTVEEKQK